jgi:hypothetical protein
MLVVLGAVMVIVLTIGPKIVKFNACRERWAFKSDKNPLHDFLRREVKPSAPCLKMLWHVKNPFRYDTY